VPRWLDELERDRHLLGPDAAVTAAMTQAVAEAEDGAWPHPELRVCVVTCAVPDGWWGGGGRILRLADIYQLAWPPKPGMHGQPRETAEQVLAARRRQEGEKLLAAAEATWGLTFARADAMKRAAQHDVGRHENIDRDSLRGKPPGPGHACIR
jgi:hypothetical protein